MDRRETKMLLIEASAVDNRVVSDPAVMAWADILEGVDYQDARKAMLEHRRSSTEYLQPAHIIALVKKQMPSTDRGISRPPAPEGRRYAVDVIEMGVLE